jgi:DNA-binding transcriptional ArsR family regulator
LPGYNEAKIEILELVSELGECTAFDIAEITGRDEKAAAMALMRYYRQGLLHRYREGYSYVYGITEKGEGRLDYLRKEKELRKLFDDIRRMPLNQE